MTSIREGTGIEERRGFGILTVGGPITEAALGIAVIVLAILGLVNVASGALASIATIVVGVALLLQGVNFAAEYARAMAGPTAGTLEAGEVGGGVTVEFLAGGVGIVLGILSLFGANTYYLLPAALIVFGGALLLAGGVTAQMSTRKLAASQAEATIQSLAHQASAAAAGAQVLIGLAVGILGILALMPMATAVLVLAGLLAVGAALLLSSTATGGAMISVFQG
jgi:hypothetical protein